MPYPITTQQRQPVPRQPVPEHEMEALQLPSTCPRVLRANAHQGGANRPVFDRELWLTPRVRRETLSDRNLVIGDNYWYGVHLLVLAFGLLLADDERYPRGGHEAEGDEHEERDIKGVQPGADAQLNRRPCSPDTYPGRTFVASLGCCLIAITVSAGHTMVSLLTAYGVSLEHTTFNFKLPMALCDVGVHYIFLCEV